MAQEINSFVVYTDIEEILDQLDNEQAGQLFRSIVAYATRREVPQDKLIRLVMTPIMQQMDRDQSKWENTKKKRKEAIDKRWGNHDSTSQNSNTNCDSRDTNVYKSIQTDTNEYKRIQTDTNEYKCIQDDTNAYKPIQTDTNDTVNVNDNVNVNVNDNVNVNVNNNNNKRTLSGKPDAPSSNQEDVAKIINHLNRVSGKHYRPHGANADIIKARLREKYSVDDCIKVIDNMRTRWEKDPKMEQYLRPETLFARSHFDSYLNAGAKPITQSTGKPSINNFNSAPANMDDFNKALQIAKERTFSVKTVGGAVNG